METRGHQNAASEAFLGAAAAGPWDRRVALAFAVLSFVGVAAIMPFARVPLLRLPAFVPLYESSLWLSDVLTAMLLLGQFVRSRAPSVLALAGGYLTSTMIIPAHLMAFPGVFTPEGLMDGVAGTTAWMYVYWHGAFPLFVLGYSVLVRLEQRRGGLTVAHPGVAITGTVALIAVLAAAAVYFAVHPPTRLPIISPTGHYGTLLSSGIGPGLLALTLLALAVVWTNRRNSVLDVWLMVVLSAWTCDVMLSTMVSTDRYDLGWYAGRIFALSSGVFLLGVLLMDLSRLYARLAEALEAARAQNEALVRSREELTRAQRMEAIGQLTGGIAHDFNNILTAITGCLEMIARRPGDVERVSKLSRHASNAADRGAQLIRQLLTFSRRQSLKPEVLDVNGLLSELRTLASKALGEAITLVLDLADDLERVFVDAGEFQACILNLVGNARDAMPAGGVLTIRTRNVHADRPRGAGEPRSGAYVLVSVSDTGQGMDAVTLARVFEPFFTTKEIGKGTGLGLSQVYGFAESAGGFVTIQSKPGSGTTVSLYLPHTQASEVDLERMAPARVAGAERTRILVVEDDPDVIATTAETLRDCGFEVLTAAGGGEALELLKNDPRIDVLFSDVVMSGGMNGVELAEAGLRLQPQLKVLLTSGYSQALLEDRGLSRDLPTLVKPYHRDDLLRELDALLRAPEAEVRAVR